MSKKIIANLFNYAVCEDAKGLVIQGLPNKLALDYHFADAEKRSFGLPKKLEKDLGLALRQILKIAPDELITKKYCKIEDKNYHLTFYLTITPSSSGEKIIINIISKDNKELRLRQLGLQKKALKTLEKNLRKRSGLILISSPEGHGRSTTLYALLRELDTLSRSTYFLGNINDRQIDGVNNLRATKNNWTKVLNLDSEIIISEISNEEDLKNAITAAASGRLVLSTILANSVWEVLILYLKLKMPLKLKLDCLKLILNQRVVSLKRATRLKLSASKKIRRQKIGLFEIIELTPNLKNFLLETKNDKSKEKFWEKLGLIAIKDGYEPLSSDQKKKIKNGLIDKHN